MIGREGLEQERPTREREHEDVVAFVEIADKFGDGGLRLRNFGLHTAGSIDQDADRNRRVQVLPKELDRSILTIDRKLEVAALQAGDITPLLIGDRHGDLLITL